MNKAIDIANYFLSKEDADAGDLISNLKLQKLLYYAQGYYLAMYNKELFSDSIEAWAHGPVVPSIYRKFRVYKDGALPSPKNYKCLLDKKTKDFLDEIYKVFGQFSAWKLRNMTHMESPWRRTEQNDIIDNSLLRDYFKTRLA